jgi:hypothetical protein
MDGLVWSACADEFLKIAVKLRVIHGTNARYDKLRAGVGPTVLTNDPNPRRVYLGLSNRRNRPSIGRFAHEAVEAKGGSPVIAEAKVDTAKGWLPSTVKPGGPSETVDDAIDIIDELDSIKGRGADARKKRGPLWRRLHASVGRIQNDEVSGATVTPRKYKPAR